MSAPEITLPMNFSYLYEISDNDREFVKEMIETITKNVPENLAEIKAARQSNDWIEIGRLVHKIKPSLLLLNIDSLSAHIKSFENNAKKQVNLEMADIQHKELEGYCNTIISELKQAVADDSF